MFCVARYIIGAAAAAEIKGSCSPLVRAPHSSASHVCDIQSNGGGGGRLGGLLINSRLPSDVFPMTDGRTNH